MDVASSDLVTIGVLIALEGLLSADNAMVLAVLVLGLPVEDRQKALRYGIIGAFVFRILAILLAAHLIQINFVMLVGAAYLLWLPYKHFTSHATAAARRIPRQATPWLGLSAFWGTVARVEMTDVVFAIDSILVAVAMSDKRWVIITGGILGIIAMRVVIGQLLSLVNRYPALVDGAFMIIAWVGVKLLLEYLHSVDVIHFQIPKVISLGLIAVIFGAAFIRARMEGPVQPDSLEASAVSVLAAEDRRIDADRTLHK